MKQILTILSLLIFLTGRGQNKLQESLDSLRIVHSMDSLLHIADSVKTADMTAIIQGNWVDTVSATDFCYLSINKNTVRYAYISYAPNVEPGAPYSVNYIITRTPCSKEPIPKEGTDYYFKMQDDTIPNQNSCYYIVALDDKILDLYFTDGTGRNYERRYYVYKRITKRENK